MVEMMKVIAVSEKDIETLQLIEDVKNPKEADCPPEMKQTPKPSMLIADNSKEKSSPWKFALHTTLTGPKGKIEKNVLTADNSAVVTNRLNDIIKGTYSSYEARMKAVSEKCNGLNDYQKISMASQLGGKLGNIYDFSRAGGGSNAVVTPEEQWQALKSGQAAGVCRDAALTLSQFLLACGFKKDQVAIKSYRSEGAGHQVTSIKTASGEYTINWSELYQTDGTQAPNPNLANTGLYYSTYDPQTGKIIEERRTDFGNALKMLAGGTPSDPTYSPQMILFEAANDNGITAKLFHYEDETGNVANGVAGSKVIHTGGERSFTHLAFGAALLRNERDVPVNNTNWKLTQNMFYIQGEAKIQKEFPIIKGEKTKLSVAPYAAGGFDFMMASNNFNGYKSGINSMSTETKAGGTIYFDRDPIKAYLAAEAVVNYTDKYYNTENGKSESGVYINRYSIQGGASWEKGHVVASAHTNFIISQLEKQTIVGVGVADKKTSTSCQAIYTVYNRVESTREDFLISRCSKDFSIAKIGKATIDISTKTALATKKTTLMIGATIPLQ